MGRRILRGAITAPALLLLAGCGLIIGINDLPGVPDAGPDGGASADGNTNDSALAADAGTDGAGDATADVYVCPIGTYDAGGPSGSLDESFANGPKLTANAFNPFALTVDGSGNTYVAGCNAGCADMAIVKFGPTGTRDTTFGGTGVLAVDFGHDAEAATAIAVDPTGKLVAVGYTIEAPDAATPLMNKVTVARFTTGGALDNNFNGNGKLIVRGVTKPNIGFGLAFDSQKILISGSDRSAFDNPSGTSGFVVRINADGSSDSSFAGSATGVLVDSTVHGFYGVAVDPASHAVVAVGSNYPDTPLRKFVVRRYTASGAPDATFGDAGLATARLSSAGASYGDEARSVLLLPSGKLLVAGTTGQPLPYGVGRTGAVIFGPNGAIDTTFGIDAGLAFGPATIAVNLGYTYHAFQRQCDGKLVVGGFVNSPSPNLQDLALGRFSGDGKVDTAFGEAGVVSQGLSGNDIISDLAVDATTGRLVVAGRNANGQLILYRYNP